MSDRYWLLLEKSDETRISKGIDGYHDRTGESYHYDSLVPNHKQLGSGDFVVLRKESAILGVGRVLEINQETDAKIHRRCPECDSTDIRERSTRMPRWKCGKCAHEFSGPNETIVQVESFVASIGGFARLNSPPSVHDVKRCAVQGDGRSSQLSILELEAGKIKTLLEGRNPSPSAKSDAIGKGGQGFGLSQEERREVELRAMRVARELYENLGWEVTDTSGSHPYDFLAARDGERRYIEVKGTVGYGKSVILTRGEVNHVQNHRGASALVVVTGIALSKSGGSLRASGGEVAIHEDPWIIDEKMLEATEYRYTVPQPPAKDGFVSE